MAVTTVTVVTAIIGDCTDCSKSSAAAAFLVKPVLDRKVPDARASGYSVRAQANPAETSFPEISRLQGETG